MRIVLAHGGSDRPPHEEFLAAVQAAALTGYQCLDKGVLTAAEKAVNCLEDDPRFNAGFGAELNRSGQVEMDAGIVDGATGRCGFVTAIQGVRNPVSVARRVMEETNHVILSGEGATRFARTHDFPAFVEVPDERRRAWEQALATEAEVTDQGGDTVGCLVVSDGVTAAASSTGGTILKLPGRVGDTGVLGAGILANSYGAVLCTGVGEAFIRTMAAASVLNQIALGVELTDAVRRVLAEVVRTGGHGAIMAADMSGRVVAVSSSGQFPVALVVDGEVIEDFTAAML